MNISRMWKEAMAAVLIAVMVIVALPVSCTTGGNLIKLGSVVPTTGTMSGRFDQVTYAMQKLADEINDGTHPWAADGGGLLIGGTVYKLQIIVENSDQAYIYNSFLKLTTEDKVVAAFGTASSQGVLNCQPINEERGLIYISYAGASDIKTMYYGGLPSQFFFRMVSLDQFSMGPKYEACFGEDGPFNGLTKVFRLDTTDDAGTSRDNAARAWAEDDEYGVDIVQTKWYTVGTTVYSAAVTSAISLGAEVIDVGGMRDADMINLLKEIESKGYEGKVFATSGGGSTDTNLWTVFEGDTTKYDFVYSLYHPGTLEDADPDFIDWAETGGETIPDWMQEAYDYAVGTQALGGDEAIGDPSGFAKCYSVARAIVESIIEVEVTTLDYDDSLLLADAIGEKSMYDIYGELHWGGEETFGRKCALTYHWHLGQKGIRRVPSTSDPEEEVSDPKWILAVSVDIP